MRYIVELPTVAGRLLFGPFDTLEAARAWCRSVRGAWIRPVIDGVEVDPAAVVAAGSVRGIEAATGGPIM